MVRSKRSLVVEGTRRLTRSKRGCGGNNCGTHKSKRSKRGCDPSHPRRRLRSKRCHHTGYKRHHMGQRGGYVCGGRHNKEQNGGYVCGGRHNKEQRGGQGCAYRVSQRGGTGCHCNGTGKPHSHNKRFSKVSGFSFGSSGGYKKRNMGPAPRIQ